MDLDNALFASDFRATERFGQLIIQVAGRAGREKVGKVLLQTFYPNNPLIQAIASYNYDKFTTMLLTERQESSLPPFSHQILWRVQGNKMSACLKFLINIKNLALDKLSALPDSVNKNCHIFGPIPSGMEKRNKKYHAMLLLQHTNRLKLQRINMLVVEHLLTQKVKTSIQWSIDVDPKEIF
jgi:primosomal protein N' (replication factor Y) (superfamily II helicase)